jgi:hypothetical protein
MRDELKALRKEAGAKIDPNTADVWFGWGQIIDPYGDYDDLRPEEECIGRLHYARSPDSIAVSFYDLPQQTRDALEQRLERGDFELRQHSPKSACPLVHERLRLRRP